jgi:hypothetical protein
MGTYHEGREVHEGRRLYVMSSESRLRNDVGLEHGLSVRAGRAGQRSETGNGERQARSIKPVGQGRGTECQEGG